MKLLKKPNTNLTLNVWAVNLLKWQVGSIKPETEINPNYLKQKIKKSCMFCRKEEILRN